MRILILGMALCCAPLAASAQDAGASADRTHWTAAEWQVWIPDVAELTMPRIDFSATPDDVANYDRYFIFHRVQTDFATALGDVRDCDGHARGLVRSEAGENGALRAYNRAYAGQYAMAPLVGGLGGALIGSVANSITASAEVRRRQRANMRRCMFFKGYARYGLCEARWRAFHFEDSEDDIDERDRQRDLALQALVASGPQPQTPELGL